MASVTSASLAIPSFTGLKTVGATTSRVMATTVAKADLTISRLGVKASMKEVGVAMVATTTNALLANNALGIEILLGSSDDGLVFEPNNFSIAYGEKIVFKNNVGFPYNVLFDEDEVLAGVDVSKISMSEEDLLNSAGETYSVTLTVKGTYGFYCAPYQGARMVGKVTVN